MFAGISPFAYLLSQLCWRPLPLVALLVANLLSKSNLRSVDAESPPEAPSVGPRGDQAPRIQPSIQLGGPRGPGYTMPSFLPFDRVLTSPSARRIPAALLGAGRRRRENQWRCLCRLHHLASVTTGAGVLWCLRSYLQS